MSKWSEVEPAWSADDLIVLQLVGAADQHPQARVGRGKTTAGLAHDAERAVVGLVWLDGCHLELRRVGGRLREQPRPVQVDRCARQSDAEREDAGPARRPAILRRDAEQSLNPIEQRVAGNGHRHGWHLDPLLLERRERARIAQRIAARLDREVVAAQLPLEADPIRRPPDRRVVEEHGLGHDLEHVDQVVPPFDVRELVGNYRFQLRCASVPSPWPA